MFASRSISNTIENEILIKHIPKQIKCDYGAIKVLRFLGRILFKNKFCFEILDSFYVRDTMEPGSSNTMGYLRENDVKDI